MSKAQFLAENLKSGEFYCGLILGANKEPDYHLVLLPEKPPAMTWNDAVAWAESIGGALPNRKEAGLAHINAKDQFEPAWHWTSEQVAHGDDYAWMQLFDFGGQGNLRKSSKLRARAVRRLFIIE